MIIIQGMINGAALGLGIFVIMDLIGRWKAGKTSLLITVVGSALVFAALLALNIGLNFLKTRSELKELLSILRQQPLVGETARRFPEADTLLIDAARKDLGRGRTEEPLAVRQAGKEIRKRFIVPALRKSPDAAINRAFDAKRDFLAFVRDLSADTCGTIIINGVQDPLKLEGPARALFISMAEAEERAMVAGIEAQVAPQERTIEEVQNLIAKLQLSPAYAAVFKDMPQATKRDVCEAMNSLFKQASMLPAEEKAVLARFVLSDGI